VNAWAAKPRLLPRACLWAVVAVCYEPLQARAHDVSDEQTFGQMKSTGGGAATPYWSNRVHGSIDASDALTFDLGTSVTRYAASPTSSGTTIFQLLLAASYMPSEHITLDASLLGSPRSTSVERGLQVTDSRIGAARDKTSAFGGDLGIEYDTAGTGNFESAISLSLGATSYSTTQAIRLRRDRTTANAPRPMFGDAEQASLLQWRADVNFTETLYENTDLSLSGTYYLYSRATAQSGYYGPDVIGRLPIGDSIPVAPLQYTLRPSITQRFGALSVRGYVQYGEYRSDEGSIVVFGLKVQYKFARVIRVWIAGNAQQNYLSSGELEILWASLGARFVF
jgi:hypothetical protein